ncbi:hypothetical protein ALC57_08282 [Trachymyrmex cornetzi]|uniref:Ubiquitin-like protease family profile domain-containing protein n=1 Tax=Trachymyrmex cornetzi TaxID=471704 RepID=A0A151J761_9HYME|nr:hypothetical protein ALC57_08282 [Trachymyrmex cornetzi]
MSIKTKGITLESVEKNIIVRASCSDYKPVETWRIQLLDTIQAVFYDRKNIFIQDSLNKRTLHNQHKQFVEKLFPTYDFEKNPVKFPTVQRQPNYSDCGVFAIAFATSLLFNIKPDKIKYEHKLMCSHLMKILETDVIEHFPQDSQHVQKVFPLAVIRAREAEANRKRTVRQYETKEQKLSQLRKCDNNFSKKEFKNNCAKKRYRYTQDLENNRGKKRRRYAENLENNRDLKRRRYEDDLENNRAKKRRRYEDDLENNRAKQRYRYEDNLENNRAKKRMRYLTNFQHERGRQKKVSSCKWLYNKRYYEKRKSISSLVKQNRNTAKNIIKKYEKCWSRNYMKYYNPEAIKNIFNKLDIKNNVEKQLESEKMVRRCMQIRDKYVHDMYKILALVKKKSEVCLILTTKCKTIDEKLIAFCGKSKHTASSENYFIDRTYRNISSSQVLAMNMKGQVTNVLPLIEAQAKKSWLCDNHLCKTDAFLIDCYEKILQAISICIFKKIPELLQKIHKCTIKSNLNTKLSHTHICYIDTTLCKAMSLPIYLLSPHFPKVRYIKLAFPVGIPGWTGRAAARRD